MRRGRSLQHIHAWLSHILLLSLIVLTACAALPSVHVNSSHLVVQSTPKSSFTYVAIGASDTFGIGTDDPQTESWPSDLAGKLGTNVRFINLGIPAIDAHQALHVEVPIAIDSHPNLITVWLAVNDLADNVPLDSYTHDLDQVLGQLRAAVPQARIAVANVPDLTLLPHFQSYDPQILRTHIAAYNARIATLVTRYHALLVDLYVRWNDLTAHPEYISDDGFHPNALGYTRLAEIFYQVLQS
jgi:lysophospholipase L1-like esterase